MKEEKHLKIKTASILGMLANIFLFIIKLIVGLIFRSQAMIADSFNSGGDIVTSFITFIGNRISSKPSDDDHNLGHGKAEYIYSLLISILIILTSFFLLKDSLITIYKKEQLIFSKYLIIVCIITIVIKFSLYIYTNKLSKKYNNLLIKANSIDHRNDTIITSLSLISILLSKYNIYILDSIVGILIAIWIIYVSIKIFIESYDVLMDKSIDKQTKDEVFELIRKYDEIKRVEHFNSTPVGYQYQISLTIYVDGNLSTFKSHEIANKLEKDITNSIDEIYLTVIHVNPIEIEKNKE